MENRTGNRKCKCCQESKSVAEFVDSSGNPNPKGWYCAECYLWKQEKEKEEAKRKRESQYRKLKIIYGEWWPYYATPIDCAVEIYEERSYCLYCGNHLPPMYFGADPVLGSFRGRAHLDHMDPLEQGGEDSIRNAVYVCDRCNYKKGRKSFIDWLALLAPERAKEAREVYLFKHGHLPEDFKKSEPKERSLGGDCRLYMEEEDLQKMYPEPEVTGPPKNYTSVISLSIERGADNKLILKPKIDRIDN